MSNCVTTDCVLEYPVNGCPAGDILCIPHEAMATNLLEACEIINQFACFPICPEQECRKFSGNGSCILTFSQKLSEMTSIETIGCDDCDLDLEDIRVCDNSIELCEGTFPCGHQNIQICGIWGEGELNPLIKKAIILLTLELSQPGLVGLQSSQGLVDSVTWDDFSVNYNTADIDVSIPTTGYPAIDRLVNLVRPTNSTISVYAVGGNCGLHSNCCGDRYYHKNHYKGYCHSNCGGCDKCNGCK